MAVVYRHRRLDSGEVFYVGIGKTLRRPFRVDGRNNWWSNIVNKYGHSVEILVEDISWENACELECLLIKEYGRLDLGTGCLVNMTDGGDGSINFKHTKESKELISKNTPIRRYWKGKVRHKTTIDNMSKPVTMFDLSGNTLGDFSSIKEASKLFSIKDSNISQVCKNKRKTAGGFIWKYKEDIN